MIELMHPIQPTQDIGDAEPDLSTDSNAGRSPAIGAQVVDRLYVHAEVLGELACGQHGFETEPCESLRVHTPQVRRGAHRDETERDGAMALNRRFQASRSKSKPAEHLRAAFCEHAITRAFVVNKWRVSQVSAFQ